MAARTACGRNLLRTPMSTDWAGFTGELEGNRCAKCVASSYAAFIARTKQLTNRKQKMKSIPFSYVRQYYANHQPTGHWFDRGTMDFFKTLTPANAYETSAGVLFVTRETNPSGEKAYTVRRQHVSGSIDTVGEFHSFKTGALARAEIKRLDKMGA